MNILSFSPFGYEGSVITVESDLRKGIPAVDIVGLADGSIKEARERVICAIKNSGYDFPTERVLLSLSPCDIKKEGAGFDLPIALSIIIAKAKLDGEEWANYNTDVFVMGELELGGNIRNVNGVYAGLQSCNAKFAIVPKGSQKVKGIHNFEVSSLNETVEALKNISTYELNESDCCTNNNSIKFDEITEDYEYGEIKGHSKSIEALQIAVAGGHHIMFYGQPGCGKTMLMQKVPGITPLLNDDEAQSVTRIYSLAGLVKPNENLVKKSPFRMPHQTASIEGICGGGINCRPGEISLAHNGILFLDEASEFKSSVLQILRVPLERNSITLSRCGRSTVYPAKFQLMMATNSCPCGNYGAEDKICLCSAKSIEMYWRKFSNPLLDKISIKTRVEVDKSDNEIITTKELRENISKALERQYERQGKKNQDLLADEVMKYCNIDGETKCFLDKESDKNDLSSRSVLNILRVTRTIADINGAENIRLEDIKKAIKLHGNEVTNFIG